MATSTRPSINPDSARTGVAVAAPGDLVTASEQATFDAHVALVKAAPGAALLVWGPEAICLAYNRAYRSLAALRASALGKPLFAAQPEIERAWKGKLEHVFAGKGMVLEGVDFGAMAGGEGATRSIGAEQHAGWLLPVIDAGGAVRGALALFMDVAPVVEPYRRVLQTVAQELRDAIVSVRLVADRLSRVPKLTAERCIADLGRILEIASEMDRSAHDLTLYARVSSGAIQLNPRNCDLGVIVQSVCDELSTPIELGSPSSRADSLPPRSTLSPPPSSAQSPSSRPPPSPIRVSVVDVQGSWDADAIRWIVVNMVTSVRKHGSQGGEIGVSVIPARESAVLAVRGEGRGLREEDLDFFDPSKRSAGVMLERRRTGVGLELFIARALVEAHGGRLNCERAGVASFQLRAVLPVGASGSASRRG
jgi:signal transduction histidine kinase